MGLVARIACFLVLGLSLFSQSVTCQTVIIAEPRPEKKLSEPIFDTRKIY